MRQVSWPQVVLGLGTMALFFGTVIALTKMGVDAAQLMITCVALLVSVLSVLGWRNQDKMDQKIDQVKEVSNGRLSEQIELNRQLQARNEDLQGQITALALRMDPRDSL